MSQALAPAVASFRQEVPSKAKEGEYFVLYIGDKIPDKDKSKDEIWATGGIIKNNFLSLQYRRGFIRRCEITQLRSFYQAERVNNFLPTDRKYLTKMYSNIENGEVQVVGVTKDGKHDGLLRVPFHPGEQIDRLTAPEDGIPSGIVRMPCNSPEEALAAQFFLFPNWNQIVQGEASLPFRAQDCKKYFESRKDAVTNTFEQQVLNAAIKACDDFIVWCNATATSANAEFDKMSKVGGWSYGTDAECAFLHSFVQRKDTVQQNNAIQMDKLTENISKMAEVFSQKAPTPQPFEPMDPDAYREFLEFQKFKAEQKKAQTDAEAPVKPEIVLDGELTEEPKEKDFGQFGQCTAIKVTGAQCEGKATANGYCFAHQKLVKE